MRTIWLVRHCLPDFPEGKKLCIGQKTDLPLSAEGQKQAGRLAEFFRDKKIDGVYSSPLLRCMETAGAIAGSRISVSPLNALLELDVGEWEGKPLADIRRDCPELAAARGEDNSIPPPGGESYDEGLLRIRSAIAQTSGDCVIVAHAGLDRSLLCPLSAVPYSRAFSLPQPYGCINQLTESGGELRALRVGVLPNRFPDGGERAEIFRSAGTPENVQSHCLAVAALALDIAQELKKHGAALDTELIEHAALLHDVSRAKPNHAAAGAELLRALGYEELSKIVAVHHDLPPREGGGLTEPEIVYLADKLVSGETRVSLSRRFQGSAEKCQSAEAKKSHARRRADAERINEEIKAVTGLDYGNSPES